MKYLLYSTFFILGACIISFLKVIAHDYPQLDFTRRSHCDYCHRILRWYEIIPLMGYFIVHGKCLTCKKQIDFGNPLQEFFGGLTCVTLFYFHDLQLLPLVMMLVLSAYADVFYGYTYAAFYLICLPTVLLNYRHLHFGTAFLCYLLLILLSKDFELGLGDIEILSIIGLIMGTMLVLEIILLSCLLCLIRFCFNKKRSFRFIPYITIATGLIYLTFIFKT